MSNIEEDIKRCKKLTEPQNANWIGISNQLAIAHLIERIKDLEEKNKNRVDFQQKYIEVTNLYLNSIPKQKVKDKIEELKLSGGSNGKDNVENLARELATEALEELLEEK